MMNLLFLLATVILSVGCKGNTTGDKLNITLHGKYDGDTYEETIESELVNVESGPNLEAMCIFLNISLSRCSCHASPALCPFQRFVDAVLNTTDNRKYTRTPEYTLVYTTITIIASTFGIIANAIVLFVAYTQRHDLSSCKLHIAELALVNFVFSVMQALNAIPLFWTNRWIYSLPMCKIVRALHELGSLATIAFILIIAVERFVLIIYPLLSNIIEGRFKHIVVAIYILLAIATVIPYGTGLDIEEGSGRCVHFHGKRRSLSLPYNWFVIVVFSVIPLCTITALYGIIMRYLSIQVSYIDANNNGALLLRKNKTNRRICCITLTILFCFLLSTLPTRIILIYTETTQLRYKDVDLYFGRSKDLTLTLAFVGYVTLPFQCTINPILYSFVDKEWRKEFRKVLISKSGNNSASGKHNGATKATSRNTKASDERNRVYTLDTGC